MKSPEWTNIVPEDFPGSPPEFYFTASFYDAANNQMMVLSDPPDVWVLSNANALDGIPTWTDYFPSGESPYGWAGPNMAVYDPASNRATVLFFNAENIFEAWVLAIKAHMLTIAAGSGGSTEPVPGTYFYDEGTEVSITALPESGYIFNIWTGNIPQEHEDDNPITITMDSDKSITAGFIRQYTLTAAAGIGGTTDPAPGTHTYDPGTDFNMTATPNSGYEFSGWSGDASGIANPITIVMESDKSITASFSAIEEENVRPCFIATAAYGSPLHSYVGILQDFRDTYLMPTKLGSVLVCFYYKYSPYVAELIAKHKVLKAAVRFSLMPVIVFSYSMLHFGSTITAFMLAFIFALPIFFIWFYRRK